MAKRVRKSAGDGAKPDDGMSAASGGNGSDDTTSAADLAGAGTGPATVNPAELGGNGNDGDGSDSEPRRKRGRPPGSGAGKTKTGPINLSGLEKILVSTHAMLAAMVTPELALDDQTKAFDGGNKTEAEYLAASIRDVAQHYQVSWLDQKTVDWINLLQCCGAIYGSRIMAMRVNRPIAPAPAAPRQAPPTEATVRPNANSANVAEIAGFGKVEFPANHPLSPKPN